jgi:hypothetical protein
MPHHRQRCQPRTARHLAGRQSHSSAKRHIVCYGSRSVTSRRLQTLPSPSAWRVLTLQIHDANRRRPVDLGGLVIIVLANVPKVSGFKPGRGRWIFNHHHMALQPNTGPGLHFWSSVTITFLQGWIVSPAPNPQPGGPSLRIFDSRRQGGPAITPGTGYPF